MAIIINLDVMMAKRKMSLNELSEKVDLTLSNLSILKTGKAKAIRFTTLEAICNVLDCQPGDILEYREFEEKKKPTTRVMINRQSQYFQLTPAIGYGCCYSHR
jgi:putative transcriptional regulator